MKARRFDFYFDDWLVGTVMLTPAERGVYITAVAAIGSHGGPLLKTELRRLCPMHGNSFNSCIKNLISLGKLVEKGAYFTNKRAASEVKKAAKRVRSAVENGRKGGRPHNKNNELEKPDGLQNAKPERKLPSPSPSPSPEEEEDSEAIASAAEAPGDPVKELWDRGKRLLGPNKGALLGKMRREHGDVAVLNAIVACEMELPSEPASFLIACLARVPPKNGHDKQSPVTTLYEGALRAADKLDREERDRRVGGEAVVALLDGSRSR